MVPLLKLSDPSWKCSVGEFVAMKAVSSVSNLFSFLDSVTRDRNKLDVTSTPAAGRNHEHGISIYLCHLAYFRSFSRF